MFGVAPELLLYNLGSEGVDSALSLSRQLQMRARSSQKEFKGNRNAASRQTETLSIGRSKEVARYLNLRLRRVLRLTGGLWTRE